MTRTSSTICLPPAIWRTSAICRRRGVDQRAAVANAIPVSTRSMEEVEVVEVYMKMDADGDGVAEMMKIVMGGPNTNIVLDARAVGG